MKFFSACIVATGLLATHSASADVLCKNSDQTVKIHTFQLSEEGIGFEPIKTAAILKYQGQKSLYTGTVQKLPNRTGQTDVFNLVDDQGVAIAFSTTKSFRFNQCTRVSCEPIVKIEGVLEVVGATHVLTCTSPIF
jgi:hypothetical protein